MDFAHKIMKPDHLKITDFSALNSSTLTMKRDCCKQKFGYYGTATLMGKWKFKVQNFIPHQYPSICLVRSKSIFCRFPDFDFQGHRIFGVVILEVTKFIYCWRKKKNRFLFSGKEVCVTDTIMSNENLEEKAKNNSKLYFSLSGMILAYRRSSVSI